MDKTNKLLIAIIAILVIIGGVSIFGGKALPLGSVTVGNEYRSKLTTTVTGSTTNATLIKGSAGVLGSVVVSGTTGNSITLYDVASAANFASSTVSTPIITFATSTPAGTYTFDINFSRGLVIMATTTPEVDSIITYR